MSSLLARVVDTLRRVGCQFWDCPGPDAPFEDMRTCYVCAQIQEIIDSVNSDISPI